MNGDWMHMSEIDRCAPGSAAARRPANPTLGAASTAAAGGSHRFPVSSRE